MRQITINLLLLMICSCNAQERKSLTINDFPAFISLFETKELPFSVKCTNDYIRPGIFIPNTAEHKGNIYKSITKEDYKYLYDESTNNHNIDFRYAFKIKDLGDFYCVIYIKDSLDNEGFADPSWLILNTYTLEGNIISKLKIAGDNFDVIDMFCEINNKREIITTSYFFLKDNQCSDNMACAKKEEDKYLINDKGEIRKISSNERIVNYKVDDLGCYEEIN